MYFILYLLKLSVTIMVISTFYWLVLRKLTFYRWNRIFLLIYPALAFMMPFLNIYDFMDPQNAADKKLVQAIPVFTFTLPAKQAIAADSRHFFEPGYLLPALLVTGLLFFLVKLSINIYSFIRLKRSSVLLQEGPVKIYALKDASAHFSFGNSIFINPEMHTATELERIVLHEYTHVKQKHTYDILWAEFLCILMWFNPFAWLLRKCIRQNLEFLADQEVIEQGIAPREYQLLLLKVIGINPHHIATPFGLSFLKKRIAMMNKNKTARIHTVKFLFVLPFLTILVLSFRSIPALDLKHVFEQEPVFKELSDTIPVKHKKEMPVAPAPPVPGVPPAPPAPGALPPAPPVPAKRVVITLHADTMRLNLQKKDSAFIMLQNNDSLPLYVIDGQVISMNLQLEKMDPQNISSINILKGPDAIKYYGSSGKNGVIIITRKNKSKNIELITDTLRISTDQRTLKTNNEPIVIFNGEELTYEAFKNKNVDPKIIKSVEVINNEKGIRVSGIKGGNGLIIITTK